MDPQESGVSRTSDTMNTPNFLAPQGSELEQKSNARSRVKLAVFFVLSIHVVGLMALLLQGCKPEQTDQTLQTPPPEIPAFEPIVGAPVVTNEQLLPPVAILPPEDPETYPPITPPESTSQPVDLSGYATPAPTMQTYSIQRGDTYYSIGKAFGVSMRAIADANPGVEPTRLQLGQVINIPPTPAAVPEVAPATGTEEVIYVVKSGDTLTKIASDYGTTVRAIRSANSLQTTVIIVGQKLTIPRPETSSSTGP